MGSYRDSTEKPSISLSTNVFRMTLPKFRPNVVLSPDMVGLVSFMRGRGDVTRSEVESGLGMGRTRAYEILSLGEAEGLVERVGSGRSTAYRLVWDGNRM
ncbi:MAG: hypothetical protein IJ026_06935 [Candidatus Methanomethylophilaceae archaeon]|nr:hypothetical protein [Candidatus Methanomethylophilaceae archaeon]